METREYRFRDKSDWGSGPWQSEPDKKQWTDPATGLPCLIVRGPSGALCGYVGVAKGHPWHGLSYSSYDSDAPSVPMAGEAPESGVDVHGGLTYSDFCAEGEPEHGICHRPDPGEPERVWWFGFDCAHAFDLAPGMAARERRLGFRPTPGDVYRTLDYVEAEVASLAQQLASVALASLAPRTGPDRLPVCGTGRG